MPLYSNHQPLLYLDLQAFEYLLTSSEAVMVEALRSNLKAMNLSYFKITSNFFIVMKSPIEYLVSLR